jgi:pimeloyl-ACP methyl ester carboxylesterase
MQLEVLTRKPEASSKPTPLLFVHGAWHGAWCWEEYFLPYFAQKGYAAYALSLRGHGGSSGAESLRWASIHDYVADVAQVADELAAQHNKTRPVVIGHSMGGYTVQKYLEKYDAPAAVLVASIPVMGALPFFLRQTVKHPLVMLKTSLLMKPQVMMGTPELVHEALFSASMPRDQVMKFFPNIQNESFRLVFDSAFLRLPRPAVVNARNIPLLVLGGADDRVFPVPEAEATARAYRTQAVIFPDTAHDMMLEANWQAVADKIIGWLGEQKL